MENNLSLCKDNLTCLLDRLEDMVNSKEISIKTALRISSELTSQEEDPQNEIDNIVYQWSDKIKDSCKIMLQPASNKY